MTGKSAGAGLLILLLAILLGGVAWIARVPRDSGVAVAQMPSPAADTRVAGEALTSTPLRAAAEVSASPEFRSGLRRLGALIRDARETNEPDRYADVRDAWHGLRSRSLADLDPFFAVLREPEQRPVFKDLLALLLGHELSAEGWRRTDSVPVAAELLDRLQTLLISGSPQERADLVDPLVVGPAAKDFLWKGIRANLTAEADPRVLSIMLTACIANETEGRTLLATMEGDLDVLRALWRRSTDERVRQGCLLVLSHMPGSLSESLFIEKAEETVREADPALLRMLPRLLHNRLRSLHPIGVNPYLPVFQVAFRRTLGADSFRAYVDVAALCLSPSQLAGVLEAAAPCCPDNDIEDGVGRMLAAIRGGQADRQEIRQAFVRKP
ncbi:MAG TPA: hypothetical protein VE981_24065 [Planctomycetota bacterium]|nr:hypothetical protein [Planctomycetota bacterium]